MFTPSGKAEVSALFQTSPVRSRLGVVIDYGFIINQDVIDYFPLGIINSHFSLLPELRGADPITFAILSGQSVTGVSLMLIVAAMDEGPLLSQVPYTLSSRSTTPALTEALIGLSDDALRETIPAYQAGHIIPKAQEDAALPGHTEATYTRKLSKADGILDWAKSAEQLEREVRAFQGWPASRTTIGGRDVIITKSHVRTVTDGTPSTPGSTWQSDKEIGFYTINGILVVDELKPSGKPAMSSQAFMNGYRSLFN